MDTNWQANVQEMIYHKTFETKLSSTDIQYLNTLPIDQVSMYLIDRYSIETDRYVCAQFYTIILSLQNFDTVAFLIKMLDQPPEDMHIAYCYDLAEFRDVRARDKLIEVLTNHVDPSVRSIAAISLAQFNDPSTVAALEYAHDHDLAKDFEGVPVSRAAMWVLQQLHEHGSCYSE